jgi:hypothetical protein
MQPPAQDRVQPEDDAQSGEQHCQPVEHGLVRFGVLRRGLARVGQQRYPPHGVPGGACGDQADDTGERRQRQARECQCTASPKQPHQDRCEKQRAECERHFEALRIAEQPPRKRGHDFLITLRNGGEVGASQLPGQVQRGVTHRLEGGGAQMGRVVEWAVVVRTVRRDARVVAVQARLAERG